ncbi:MAG TPA: GGDEF domain-containing protein [Burkholderiaceae bacterium]|jgi:diguanylate cyclase (GGDEF)-like protein
MQESQNKPSTDFLTQFLVRWIIATVAASFAVRVVLNGFLSPAISDAQLVIVCAVLSLLLAIAIYARMLSRQMSERCNDANTQLATALARVDALGNHDQLTGVLNRRALIETLEWELLRAKRTGHPFCFAIIDVDHFRAVNEKYGSTAGDMVLKTLADASIKLLRALDRFGRIGGEEFGIVLPATWLDQGIIAMGRLTKAVDACSWEHIAPDLKLTFSAGITTNAVNDTAETIMKRADDAMLKAKSEGRNRTVAAEEALPDMPPIDID